MTQARHLTLDNLPINPKVARRLPLDMASRYHALPVAEDRGRITVVMADPDDVAAREAVAAALGCPPYVVEGDPVVIDALLAQLWPEMPQHSRRLLACVHANPVVNEILAFTWSIAELLDAHITHYNPAEANLTGEAWIQKLEQSHCDLILLEEPEQPLIDRVTRGPVYRQIVGRIPSSLLVVRCPRWPLKHLLLIVRGADADDAAVDWVVRLARPSGAAVTALAIVPSAPAMYDRCARMRPRLDALLRTDTPLGRQMRRVAQWLVDWGIQSTLRLRQGTSDMQIQREMAEEDYDLVVVAAMPENWWQRWLQGEVVGPLMSWVDRPVLIAKPTVA